MAWRRWCSRSNPFWQCSFITFHWYRQQNREITSAISICCFLSHRRKTSPMRWIEADDVTVDELDRWKCKQTFWRIEIWCSSFPQTGDKLLCLFPARVKVQYFFASFKWKTSSWRWKHGMYMCCWSSFLCLRLFGLVVEMLGRVRIFSRCRKLPTDLRLPRESVLTLVHALKLKSFRLWPGKVVAGHACFCWWKALWTTTTGWRFLPLPRSHSSIRPFRLTGRLVFSPSPWVLPLLHELPPDLSETLQ